jgi:ABC-type antimicrobial peptide transport system permease subunit
MKAAISPNRKYRAAPRSSCWAKRLPPTSSRDGDALGQRIRVNGVPVEVIGILESKGQSGGGGMGRDRDDTIVAPLSMVRNRITGGNRWVSRHVSRIQVLVQDGYDVSSKRRMRLTT